MHTNPSRRQVLAAIPATFVAGTLAHSQQPSLQQKRSAHANEARTAIHYDLEFKASAQRVYSAILDEKQFARFTGMAAEIDPAPGGAFTLFGGLIVGRNVELISSQRIVQAWRPTHWDSGVYSIVHFEFKPHGQETALVFDHTGFPAGEYDSLDWGWGNHYWEPLRKFLS